jgi:AAA family ATP:ADP antiporter
MDATRVSRIAGLGLLAFFILASYGLARPPIESIFLADHTSKGLPWAWLAVAAGMVAVVGALGRHLARTDLATLLGQVLGASMLLLALLLGARAVRLPGAAFLLYVWKDLYIVVLVEVFWTFANSLYALKTARWIYGLFGVLGSLGSASAGFAVTFLSKTAGISSERLPLTLFPVLLAAWAVSRWLVRHGEPVRAPPRAAPPSIADGVRLLRKSAYLPYVFALICIVQVVITLVEYQFNGLVELQYAQVELRTRFLGQVYGFTETGAMVLHGLTGVVLRALGVAGTLLAIPTVLGAGLVSFLAAPRVAVIAAVRVAAKACDYSLFRNAKEMLYLPLDYDEKTRGKAFSDMLSYRVAKGGASALLLLLTFLKAPAAAVAVLALALIAGWIATTVVIARRYRAKAEADAVAPAPEPG